VLWDAARRKLLTDEPLRVDAGKVTSVAFSPNGMTLAAGYGGNGGAAAVWSWGRGARERLTPKRATGSEGEVTSVTSAPTARPWPRRMGAK